MDVKAIVKKHGLDRYPNVIGYSNKLQYKIRKGQVLPIKCIRIYVTRKVPEHMLRKDEVIPKEVEGIPTDVVEIGKVRALAVYVDRYRPSPCGVSTSRLDETAAGTIGWWVVDEDGNVYLMSNNHVWAKENQGQQGDPLIQPGKLDGGDEDDVIAKLYDFIPIDFTGNPNYVDLAIAEPLDMSQLYTSIMEVGGVTGKKDPAVDDVAIKVGRSTGKTSGKVIDDSASVNVEYASGQALFDDVFIVQSDQKIEPGDSGSPILDASYKFMGLLFAGNDEGTVMVGCKQSRIESALQSKLNKKVWVLMANAYPPFRKEYIVQKVYPSALETMAVSLGLIAQFTTYNAVLATIINVLKDMWEIKKL